ncbi:MAG: hypothetical protein JXO72_13345 [Vicinamibacteria bacterium]|nr:hypothetical protein [Vicinamibacteria bacterium]
MRLAAALVVIMSLFAVGCDCDCEIPTHVGPTGSQPPAPSAPTTTPVAEPAATPTPTVDPTTLVFTRCHAKPPVIRSGESFEIQYAVTSGKVRLARKDEDAFAMGLTSEGSYTLRDGEAGYPRGEGVQKYRCISAANRTVWETTSVEVRY